MSPLPCPPPHLAGERLDGEELRCALAASRDGDPPGTDAAKSGAAFICTDCLREMFEGAANREAARQEREL